MAVAHVYDVSNVGAGATTIPTYNHSALFDFIYQIQQLLCLISAQW